MARVVLFDLLATAAMGTKPSCWFLELPFLAWTTIHRDRPGPWARSLVICILVEDTHLLGQFGSQFLNKLLPCQHWWESGHPPPDRSLEVRTELTLATNGVRTDIQVQPGSLIVRM
jgi:hypothetical protein